MYLHIMFCPCSLKYQLCCWTVLDPGKRQKLQILGACVHWDQNSEEAPSYSALSLCSSISQEGSGEHVSLQLNLSSLILSWSSPFLLTCPCFVFFLLPPKLSHSLMVLLHSPLLCPFWLSKTMMIKDDWISTRGPYHVIELKFKGTNPLGCTLLLQVKYVQNGGHHFLFQMCRFPMFILENLTTIFPATLSFKQLSLTFTFLCLLCPVGFQCSFDFPFKLLLYPGSVFIS